MPPLYQCGGHVPIMGSSKLLQTISDIENKTNIGMKKLEDLIKERDSLQHKMAKWKEEGKTPSHDAITYLGYLNTEIKKKEDGQ